MTELRTLRAGQAEVWDSKLVWQLPIRLFHWTFAASTVVLFVTGLYIAEPWFNAGGGTDGYLMGWARTLHFVAAALFVVSFLWRVYWFFAGNRYARSGFPFVWRRRWWREVFGQMRDYAVGDFSVAHMGHNALAGLSYVVFVIGLGILQMVTGLALFGESNPGGFWDTLSGWALPLFGGSYRTHMWHHLFAWGFVVFVILHLYIVILDDRQYGNGLVSSMISGRKFQRRGPGAGGGHDD
jgi:Ni/Fe-hydrogenase 1 B-type cytochrome subunit